MTSLVISKREPQIFCLYKSSTPVWGNLRILSEGVLYPRTKEISWLPKLIVYILHNFSWGYHRELPTLHI